MNVGIIGAGRQGRRRAMSIRGSTGDRLVAIADVNLQAAETVAGEWGARAVGRWEDVVEDPEVEVVLISVPPNLHFPIAMAAIDNKKHILVEKPLALNVEEGTTLVEAANRSSVLVKCGFNLRFHPGIQDMYRLIKEGAIGEVCFVECRYGIGGRPGYDEEWRAYRGVAGGGELFDRGIHIVDLFRWFMGDFQQVHGVLGQYFWKFEEGMEDNGFGVLRTAKQQTAMFHVSATQWRNSFYLEVCGTEGYLVLKGLGYVYGTETLIKGMRPVDLGPQKEEVIYYIGEDRSWVEEWQEFSRALQEGCQPLGNGEDGLEGLRIIQALYESVELDHPVLLERQ